MSVRDEGYSFWFVIRMMYWASAFGQAFEAIWLGQPVRAGILACLYGVLYVQVEVVAWCWRRMKALRG